MSFSLLPLEVKILAFSYLLPKDLASAGRVSKQWKRVADDERIWRVFLGGIKIDPHCHPKQFLSDKLVVNALQLCAKLNAWAASSHRETAFKVVYPFFPGNFLQGRMRIYGSEVEDVTSFQYIFCLDQTPQGKIQDIGFNVTSRNETYSFQIVSGHDPQIWHDYILKIFKKRCKRLEENRYSYFGQ